MEPTELNERTTIKLPVGIAWSVAVGMLAAAFWGGMVYFEIRQVSQRISKLEDHERRIIRIETKLGISSYNRHTNSVMVFSTRGDL